MLRESLDKETESPSIKIRIQDLTVTGKEAESSFFGVHLIIGFASQNPFRHLLWESTSSHLPTCSRTLRCNGAQGFVLNAPEPWRPSFSSPLA